MPAFLAAAEKRQAPPPLPRFLQLGFHALSCFIATIPLPPLPSGMRAFSIVAGLFLCIWHALADERHTAVHPGLHSDAHKNVQPYKVDD